MPLEVRAALSIWGLHGLGKKKEKKASQVKGSLDTHTMGKSKCHRLSVPECTAEWVTRPVCSGGPCVYRQKGMGEYGDMGCIFNLIITQGRGRGCVVRKIGSAKPAKNND